jgi:Mrp family chromosome partitioning ATPase
MLAVLGVNVLGIILNLLKLDRAYNITIKRNSKY